MAATEPAQPTPDRTDKSGRRRPFSTWMKKLTNFKSGHSTDANQGTNSKEKRNTYQTKSGLKKGSASKNNNPYPESGRIRASSAAPVSGSQSFSTVPTGNSVSASSLSHDRESIGASLDSHTAPTTGTKSTAAASADAAHSEVAPSHAASSGEGNTTIGCGVSSRRGPDSTFSTPAPSVRSLTTTLTTIHSAAPNGTTSNGTVNGNNSQTIQFSHQFPASPPPSALPAHLAPQGSGGHPSTYTTATANNLLTDNASILTLASSSKRRRRRSMDTDASVRALAPSSLFGGSRESLPLSVLSATVDSTSAAVPQHTRPAVSALNDRASIYSATGVAPALPSERNSYYAGKPSTATADGGSMKSGLLGHGRNNSITGSIGGLPTPSSPLATTNGRLSRSNSGWEENDPSLEDDHKDKA
ncbi:hypothetical protein B0O99DRAFT_601462 [Bisporella sp. PMI_857]|nr:hypothetical protein B0O99DRAFT_601462 [Bisporella sp. PMI_857]